MRGQIGQPAACMMENKWSLRTDAMPTDYGVHRWPTEHVDKFVQNYGLPGRRAASVRGFDKLMTNLAIRRPTKSMTYYANPCNARDNQPHGGLGHHLWGAGTHVLKVEQEFLHV